MKRLREKLHSRRGASILLALLLFLICCMVAASVLAAAASNAGRMRSSRVEQQKQLTLSSALELVCGQLEQANYTGYYTIYEWETGSTADSEGERYFFCVQNQGDFSCGKLDTLLSLSDEMDWIFAQRFKKAGYKSLGGSFPSNASHILKVSLPEGLEGYPYPEGAAPGIYEVPGDVTVKVELSKDTRHITVTAWLGDSETPPTDKADMMRAELVAQGALVPRYAPAGRLPATENMLKDAQGADDIKVTPKPQYTTVTWKLNWIKKGAGE